MTGRPESERPQVAVVTGAGRGLGLALAAELNRRGWRVIAVHRDAAHHEELAALGHRVAPVQVDVNDPESDARVLAALDGDALDLLVHNAGIAGAATSIEVIDIDAVRHALETHCLTPLRLTSSLLPALRASLRPRVVGVLSRWAEVGRDGGLHGRSFYEYRISKAALAMAIRALADDLAETHVAVLGIDPGPMKTRMGAEDATRTADEVAPLFLDRADDPASLFTTLEDLVK